MGFQRHKVCRFLLIDEVSFQKWLTEGKSVQIWTSVFIAGYGAVFVAASRKSPFSPPSEMKIGVLTRKKAFLPFFWSSRARIWMSLILGFALAAASITLLATAGDLVSLGIARAAQGLSGVLITGASAGLMSISARRNSEPSALSWMNISFIQAAAMAVAPASAGVLHGRFGGLWPVIYYAYAILALDALIVLVGFKLYGKGVRASRLEQRHLLASDGGLQSYGTVAAEQDSGFSVQVAGVSASVNTGSVVSLGGSIMVTLLSTALQSVLPLWAELTFNWPVSTIGLMFVALFLPATVVGPVANFAVTRAPKGARYLTALGFLSCAPAFLCLGALPENASAARIPLLLVLSAISLGAGLCAGVLFGQTTASRIPLTAEERSSAAVQATSVSSIACAWGTLLGPLVAGAVHSGWGWEVMMQTLSALSAFSGILVFLFLNGWIGTRQANGSYENRARSAIDEESAPLLAASLANAGDRSVNPKGGFYERTATYVGTDDSGSMDTTFGKHRRHFSADNFSIASTAGSHEVAQVRFHASIDLPNAGSDDPASRRSSRGSSINTERRFHMREAPHTPTTDPLLAAGNRYVIDETPSTDPSNGAKDKRKRHVVVFPEEEVSPELLQRRKHHVVTINSLDGSFKLVPNPAVDQVSMQINEEMEPAETESPGALRRYVVIVLDDGETGLDITGGESE